MKFTVSVEELDLIDDALLYWMERIDYSLNRTTNDESLKAAGQTVRRRIRALRERIKPLLPTVPVVLGP